MSEGDGFFKQTLETVAKQAGFGSEQTGQTKSLSTREQFEQLAKIGPDIFKTAFGFKANDNNEKDPTHEMKKARWATRNRTLQQQSAQQISAARDQEYQKRTEEMFPSKPNDLEQAGGGGPGMSAPLSVTQNRPDMKDSRPVE